MVSDGVQEGQQRITANPMLAASSRASEPVPLDFSVYTGAA